MEWFVVYGLTANTEEQLLEHLPRKPSLMVHKGPFISPTPPATLRVPSLFSEKAAQNEIQREDSSFRPYKH